jgi:hypothetical protein
MKEVFNYSKSKERERRKSEGFFDGRFRHKVETPKNKKSPKYKIDKYSF